MLMQPIIVDIERLGVRLTQSFLVDIELLDVMLVQSILAIASCDFCYARFDIEGLGSNGTLVAAVRVCGY